MASDLCVSDINRAANKTLAVAPTCYFTLEIWRDHGASSIRYAFLRYITSVLRPYFPTCAVLDIIFIWHHNDNF